MASEHGRITKKVESACKTASVAALLAFCFPAFGMEIDTIEPSRLGEMSLEELANIQITSVSKRPERLSDAAASVYVITADDIRRSGATTLPEVLRLAPNLQVAQTSASSYAISARGLNGSANSAPNKLLVLIDGRSAYSPLFSGVFWDTQNPMLEDIDRIEVISGPGGALWGINAVNGVINIITRSSNDTQGALVSFGGGNLGSDEAVRYGGFFDADGSYRIYAKHLARTSTSLESGGVANDAWELTQAGFRADWGRNASRMSVEGNAYRGTEDQPAPGAIELSGLNVSLGLIPVTGANLRTYWQRVLGDGSEMHVQFYIDHTTRTVPPFFGEVLDIADIQFQHALRPIGMHKLIWGGEARYDVDRIDNMTPYFAFLPADVHQRWNSVFAQDEMSLHDDFRLTLGARMEHNDYTGNEFLPTVRLAWKPASDRLWWGAISRTVRAPTRLDRDVFFPASPPFVLAGGPTVVSEVAKTFELGYRAQPGDRLSYSVTVFHNRYSHLRTQELAPSMTSVFFSNMLAGKASGLEAWGNYQVSRAWRLSTGISALHETFQPQPGSNDIESPTKNGLDPAYTLTLRSSHELTSQSRLDLMLRHVAKLSSPDVPAYTAVDIRYGYRVRPNIGLSVTVKNLAGAGHAEYFSAATRSVFDRGVFLKLAIGY